MKTSLHQLTPVDEVQVKEDLVVLVARVVAHNVTIYEREQLQESGFCEPMRLRESALQRRVRIKTSNDPLRLAV